MDKIRNIAIIAHVDHGKTTLVDCLLRQSGTFRANQKTDERMMDSMDLEREKGITIRAKNAAFQYNGYHVNIVDTPGHADFGGEVERIMGMIDGVLLVVDSHDGPQGADQVRAQEGHGARGQGHRGHQQDRPRERPAAQGARHGFRAVHGTGRERRAARFPGHLRQRPRRANAVHEITDERKDMTPLFDEIIRGRSPRPPGSGVSYLQMLVSNLDYSDYLGRIAYGRLLAGRVSVGDTIVCIHGDGRRERANVTALFGHQGMEKIEIKHASAGDIVGLCGFEDVYIGETLTDSEERPALHFVEIDLADDHHGHPRQRRPAGRDARASW